MEWAATKELEREAEAALDRGPTVLGQGHKNKLRRFLKGIPRHYVPSDAEIPVDLGERLAESRIELGMHAGMEPNRGSEKPMLLHFAAPGVQAKLAMSGV